MKSCERYYNTATQSLDAGSTINLIIAGNRVVDSGISIQAEAQSYNVLKPGLYRIEGDLLFDSTATGDVILQIYKDGVALPCTMRRVTVPATGYTAIHTETDLQIESCCCNVNHQFTYVLTSANTGAGDVTFLCTGIMKIA